MFEELIQPNSLPLSQLPHRRVTFSTANQAQDLQDASQHSYYDSGLEESETPSSKSSSGPRIGPLALPEDHYERTTPDGSIGEMEHPENGKTRWSFPSLYSAFHLLHPSADTHAYTRKHCWLSHTHEHSFNYTHTHTHACCTVCQNAVCQQECQRCIFNQTPTIPCAVYTFVKEVCDLTAAQHNQYAT